MMLVGRPLLRGRPFLFGQSITSYRIGQAKAQEQFKGLEQVKTVCPAAGPPPFEKYILLQLLDGLPATIVTAPQRGKGPPGSNMDQSFRQQHKHGTAAAALKRSRFP